MMSSVPPIPAPPAHAAVGTPVVTTPLTNALLVGKIDTLLAKLDAYAKAEEAKAVTSVKTFFAKHWPWMVGVIVAATRFLHL